MTVEEIYKEFLLLEEAIVNRHDVVLKGENVWAWLGNYESYSMLNQNGEFPFVIKNFNCEELELMSIRLNQRIKSYAAFLSGSSDKIPFLVLVKPKPRRGIIYDPN